LAENNQSRQPLSPCEMNRLQRASVWSGGHAGDGHHRSGVVHHGDADHHQACRRMTIAPGLQLRQSPRDHYRIVVSVASLAGTPVTVTMEVVS
jgi:hypothetical protein